MGGRGVPAKKTKKKTVKKTAKKTTKKNTKATQTRKRASSPRPSKSGRRLNITQLDQFRTLLITKRNLLQGDVDAMGIQALKGSDGSGSGESHMPLHLADLGTDNYEQDFTLGLIESEEEEIREIDQAIDRIQEGSFGICENCESHIPIERLKAIPHSRLCIKCQTQYEQESGEFDSF